MSQAGIINTISNSPSIPTQFDANTGVAIPIANILNIVGGTVVAGTSPVSTTGATNTITINVQRSQAIASTDATKIGLAAFNNAMFTVDANGFVSLLGGGEGIDSIGVDANTAPGTNPVLPTVAGLVTVNGAAVANHSVVLETRSRAANVYNIEVQYGAAAAAADGTKSGVTHFDSSSFAVGATGFVTLSTTGAGKTITGNTGGALSPTANNWNILGSGSITTAGSGSTLTTQLTGLTNHAVLVGAGTSTITKVGPTATAGQVLQSGGSSADPSFSTAAYPSTAGTSGNVLISDGTNFVSTSPVYFSAYLSSSASNVTGDGTEYILICDTITAQVGGSNYNNSTGVFTAPSDGFYQFSTSLFLTGLTASHTEGLCIFNWSVRSNRFLDIGNIGASRNSSNQYGIGSSWGIFMSASDTLSIRVFVLGGSKVVGVLGGSGSPATTFTAAKIR